MNDLSALRMPYTSEAVDALSADVRRGWAHGDHRVAALRLVATVREREVQLRAALRIVDEQRARMSRIGTWWQWWSPLRPSTWTAWWWGRVVWGTASGPGLRSWRLGCVERRRLITPRKESAGR